MHITILNRVYSIRRIPLRLILNGKPCDARIDYESADILIGDPDGLSRDSLLACVAAAIQAVTSYECDQAGVIADVSAETASSPSPQAPVSRQVVILSGCFQVGLLQPDSVDLRWRQAGPRIATKKEPCR